MYLQIKYIKAYKKKNGCYKVTTRRIYNTSLTLSIHRQFTVFNLI